MLPGRLWLQKELMGHFQIRGCPLRLCSLCGNSQPPRFLLYVAIDSNKVSCHAAYLFVCMVTACTCGPGAIGLGKAQVTSFWCSICS